MPNCKHFLCYECTEKMIVNKNLCPYCRTVREDICSCCRYTLMNCTLRSVRFLFMTTEKPTTSYFNVGDEVIPFWLLPAVNYFAYSALQILDLYASVEDLRYQYTHRVIDIHWDSNRETYVYSLNFHGAMLIARESEVTSFDALYDYNDDSDFSD